MKYIISFLIFVLLTACSINNNNVKIKSYKLSLYFPDSSEAAASIVFKYSLIEDGISKEAKNKINYELIKVLKNNFSDSSQNKSLEIIQQEFIEEYKSFKSDFPDAPQNWSLEKTIDTNHNNDKIIGFTYNEYSYLGGAHPNSGKTFLVFEKKSGEKIKFSDVFDSRKIDDLNNFAEKKFREKYNFDASTNYEENGFFIKNGEFELNDNFLITEDEIIFIYNPYEIAAYAIGYTDLVFKRDELKEYLKKDSNLGL